MYSSNRLQALTTDQLFRIAPSIFATQAHEETSARFTYVPTAQIIDGMRNAGFVPVRAKQTRCRDVAKRDYTKHMVCFAHVDGAAKQIGDVIPQVCLVNAHDGSSAYKIYAGMYRLVCSNGLLVQDSTITDVRVRHSGDIMGNVIEGSYRVISDATEAAQKSQEWRALTLKSEERTALAQAALTVRYDLSNDEQAPVTAEQILRPRRNADIGADLWSTFNVIQENAVKGGVRYYTRSHSLARTRAVSGIDQDTALNRALWRLADEMAALKAA